MLEILYTRVPDSAANAEFDLIYTLLQMACGGGLAALFLV